jgi:hypothetical protein
VSRNLPEPELARVRAHACAHARAFAFALARRVGNHRQAAEAGPHRQNDDVACASDAVCWT